MRKEKFVPEEYYHIYNRTISNYLVFNNEANAKRLLQAFLFANSTKSSEAFECLRNNNSAKPTSDVGSGSGLLNKALEILKQGEKLVDLLCYAIMPDHYHLLLKERKEDGIITFVHRCNISISKYINIKSNRKGPLFESRFKSKHVNSNDYLVHLSAYIHLNPLDVISGKEWREHKLTNWGDVRKQLLDFPWSSLKSFLGKDTSDNFNPIVSGQEMITGQFKNNQEYESRLKNWATDADYGFLNLPGSDDKEDNFD